MIVGDFRGNVGLALSTEGGAYGGMGWNVGAVLQGTNAPTIGSLQGPVNQVGGSATVGVGVVGVNFGVEAVLQQGVTGANLNIGLGGGSPVEGHTLTGNTWLLGVRP